MLSSLLEKCSTDIESWFLDVSSTGEPLVQRIRDPGVEVIGMCGAEVVGAE